jgi:hypothetical protein
MRRVPEEITRLAEVGDIHRSDYGCNGRTFEGNRVSRV